MAAAVAMSSGTSSPVGSRMAARSAVRVEPLLESSAPTRLPRPIELEPSDSGLGRPSLSASRYLNGSVASRLSRKSGATSPKGSDAEFRRKRVAQELEDIMHEFLEVYPLLHSSVYQLVAGQWMIAGRLVVKIRGEPALKTVLVDNVRRPLGDVLEEVLKEHQLELQVEAQEERSTKILLGYFQRRDRSERQLLWRRAFNAFRAIAVLGRKASMKVRQQQLSSCREVWHAWSTTVWLGFSESLNQRRMKGLENMVERHQERGGLLWYTLRLWQSVLHRQQRMRSLDYRQQRLQRMAATALSGQEEALDNMSIILLRWRLEVQGERRQRAESVLLGDAGRIRRDMQALGRQSSAKDLLVSAWDGPEAQLSRLSNVLDNLIDNLDVQRSAPHLARGGLRDAMRAAEAAALTGPPDAEMLKFRPSGDEALNQALSGFEALVSAKQAAKKLQNDIDYVLCLRVMSGWSRMVGDERIARGEADLGARRALHVELTRRRAHSLGGHLGNVARLRLLKEAFVEWSAAHHITKAAQIGYRSVAERDDYKLQARRLRSVAISQARFQAVKWAQSNDQILLHICMMRWGQYSGWEGRAERIGQLQRKAEEAHHAVKSKWIAVGHIAGVTGTKVTMYWLQREVFWHWKEEVHKRSNMETKLSMVLTALADDNIGIMRRAFTAMAHKLMAFKAKMGAREAGLKGALRASEFTRMSCTHTLGQNCLKSWYVTTRMSRMNAFRHALKERVYLSESFLRQANQEALMNMVFARWFGLMCSNKHYEVLNDSRKELRSLQEQVKIGKERQKRGQVKAGMRFARAFDTPLLFNILKSWQLATKILSQEHFAAAEFLRRQKLKDTEKNVLRFQCELRPKMMSKIEHVVNGYIRQSLPEVFQVWKWSLAAHRLTRKSGRHLAHLRVRMDLNRAVEAWKSYAIRNCLRAGAYRTGKAVVQLGRDSLAKRLLLSWRAACMARHGEMSAKRILAAQRIGHLMATVERSVMKDWRLQAQMMTSALEAEQVQQAQEKLAGHQYTGLLRLFDANSVSGEGERNVWLMNASMQAWRLATTEFAWERRREREKRVGGRLPLMKRALERAIGEQDRRARASRRYARWYHTPDEPMCGLPKCFAAWTLATLDANCLLCAEGLAASAASLSTRFRAAADRLLCRAFGRVYRQLLLMRSFLVLAARVRRGRQRTIVSRLCGGASLLMDTLALRRVMLSWYAYLKEGWRMRMKSEKRAFGAQASGLARRLVRMNSCTYGLLTAAGVFVRWRALSLQGCRRLILHQARRTVGMSELSFDVLMVRDAFGRWARLAYCTRREVILAPVAYVFVAWRAWLQGAAAGDRRPTRAASLPSIALSTAALSPQCPTCGNVYMLDSNFCRNCGQKRSMRKAEDHYAGDVNESLECSKAVAPGAPPEGARAGWQRWLRQALAERRLHRGFRQRKFAEAALELRRHLQARCYCAWRSFSGSSKRCRTLSFVFIRTRGLTRMAVWVTFNSWAFQLETSQLAHLRRAGLSTTLLNCLTSRTMMASFKELLLRHVFAAWTRSLSFSKAAEKLALQDPAVRFGLPGLAGSRPSTPWPAQR